MERTCVFLLQKVKELNSVLNGVASEVESSMASILSFTADALLSVFFDLCLRCASSSFPKVATSI